MAETEQPWDGINGPGERPQAPGGAGAILCRLTAPFAPRRRSFRTSRIRPYARTRGQGAPRHRFGHSIQNPDRTTFPDFSTKDALAAAKGDSAALERLGRAMFGEWPHPTPDTLEAAHALETPLGTYLRDEFFPAQLDESVVLGAVRRLIPAFGNRIVPRFKSDRGTFTDWARINIHDLAVQEALAQYQTAADGAAKTREAATKQRLEAVTPAALSDLNSRLVEHLAHQRRFAQLRDGVCHLVWHLFFDVPTQELAGSKIRLSQAATWVFNLSRRQNEGFPASRADEFAQDFFEHKVLHGDFLLRFRTELGSSFNQWLRISVENFTRDHFPNPHAEVQTFSEALSNALNSEGERVQRGKRPSDDVSGTADDTTAYSGIDESDELLFSSTPAELDASDPMPMDEQGQRRYVLQVQVLPAVFAEPQQRVFSKLMFDFPLAREDYEVLAREWLLGWAVEFALERLGGPLAEPTPADEAPVLKAIRQQFAALCKHSVPPTTKPTLKGDTVAALAEWVRQELATWPVGKRGPALTVPTSIKLAASAEAVKAELQTLHQALVAAELALPGARLTLLEGLSAALEQETGRLEAERNISATKEREEAEKSRRRLEWRILRLQAKQRAKGPRGHADSSTETGGPSETGDGEGTADSGRGDGDESAPDPEAKLAQMHRSYEQRTKELARHVNSRSDAELARLLRRPPAVITSQKNRVKRAFADFMHADHLTKQRKALATALKRKSGKALLERYERDLKALAAFEAFPKQPAVLRELRAALLDRWSDAIAAEYLKALVAFRRGQGETALIECRGRALRREELLKHGAPLESCVEYERRALQVFAALLWLKRLGEADAG